MKHREKPKYSVRQNVCFMVRTAWEKRRRVLLLCVVVAAIKVALDLAQLYVTPEILTRVEQGRSRGGVADNLSDFSQRHFFSYRGLRRIAMPSGCPVRSMFAVPSSA